MGASRPGLATPQPVQATGKPSYSPSQAVDRQPDGNATTKVTAGKPRPPYSRTSTPGGCASAGETPNKHQRHRLASKAQFERFPVKWIGSNSLLNANPTGWPGYRLGLCGVGGCSRPGFASEFLTNGWGRRLSPDCAVSAAPSGWSAAEPGRKPAWSPGRVAAA